MSRPPVLLPWEWDEARWAQARESAEAYEAAVRRREAGDPPTPTNPHTSVEIPTPAPLPPRIAAGWPARVRACPHRTPVALPSTCGCQEPALCGLGKHDDGRDVVSINGTCRECVRAGGPPPAS